MESKTNNEIEWISNCIENLVKRIGIECKVEEGIIGDTTSYTIRTHEAGLLIGEDGQCLVALNYILRKITEKKFTNTPRFLVDVNDYQRKRFEELRDTARMGAQRVRYFKKEVSLNPMTAFERRIVHLTLQEYPDITTESLGEGYERRVVIKPYY